VRLPSSEATATNVEVFLNVAFEEVGTHWIEILIDGQMKVRYPLRVTQPHPQPQPQDPEPGSPA